MARPTDTELDEKILALIADPSRPTDGEIAARVGKSWRAVAQRIRKLRARGVPIPDRRYAGQTVNFGLMLAARRAVARRAKLAAKAAKARRAAAREVADEAILAPRVAAFYREQAERSAQA